MNYKPIDIKKHPMYGIAIIQIDFAFDFDDNEFKTAKQVLTNSFGKGIRKVKRGAEQFKRNNGDSSIWYYSLSLRHPRIYLTTPDQLTIVAMSTGG